MLSRRCDGLSCELAGPIRLLTGGLLVRVQPGEFKKGPQTRAFILSAVPWGGKAFAQLLPPVPRTLFLVDCESDGEPRTSVRLQGRGYPGNAEASITRCRTTRTTQSSSILKTRTRRFGDTWTSPSSCLFSTRRRFTSRGRICLATRSKGSYSRANLALRPQWYAKYGMPEEAWKGLEQARRLEVQSTFINAWHCSEHESAAMWRLYLKADEGIAVRSTFRRLCESFQDAEPEIFVGLVQYVDYDLDPMPEGNSLWPFVHKRKSFEHEREIRAVIQDGEIFKQVRRFEASAPLDRALDPSIEPPPRGLSIPVRLHTLIERIYVPPTASDWLNNLVKSVTDKYGVTAPVLHSSLARDPVW
jgi:hypothetical protein